MAGSLDAQRLGPCSGKEPRGRGSDAEDDLRLRQTKAEAEKQGGIVADAPREKQPKLGALMDACRDDVLASMSFPREHWAQIASTNPLERVNRKVKRRSGVIGIFPNNGALVRRAGALMLETHDEWAVARRYMSLGTLARVTDNPNVRLPAVAT